MPRGVDHGERDDDSTRGAVHARRSGVEVFTAPLDVRLDKLTVLQPDVLLVRQADLGASVLEGLPLLAVEVLSPATRHVDLELKRARYERSGVPSYWVVDPELPRLLAWDLRDGRYAGVGDVTADEGYDASRPCPVRIVPDDLVRD